METNSPEKEKRQYYRLQPVVEPEPQASFEIDGKTFDVKVVNLSPGGLLCYVDEKSTSFSPDILIPKIVVKIADKETVTYAGKIVRVQPTSGSQKKFCGVEFIKFGERVLDKDKGPPKPFNINTGDESFVERLESCKTFLKVSSIEEEIKTRKMIYDNFQTESERLPLDERWYFYEIIDEMKLREPNYSDGLKQEFLRLCRGEERKQAVATKKITKSIKSFFKKILPF